jgi:hypothetical protein
MINGISKSYKADDISEIKQLKKKRINTKLKKKIKKKSFLGKAK